MSGYIFCVNNELMPNILKLGYTTSSLDSFMNQVNSEKNMWNPPSDYTLKYAKQVNDCENKFRNLEKLMKKYQKTALMRNSFYKVDLDDILIFLDLMDGDEVDLGNNDINNEEQVEEQVEELIEEEKPKRKKKKEKNK